MDTGLLINAFVVNVGAVPSPPKAAEARNAGDFRPKPADDARIANGPQKITPDNAPTDTPRQVDGKPRRRFRHRLKEEMGPKGPQEGHNTAKPEAKPSAPPPIRLANQPAANQSQVVLTESLAVAPALVGKAVAAEAAGPLPQQTAAKIQGKAVPLLKSSKVSVPVNLTVDASKQTTENASPEVPAAPGPAGKLVQLAAYPGQTEPKIVQADLSKGQPAADAQSGQARQAAEMAVSGKAVGAQEPAADPQSGQARQAAEMAVSGKAVGAQEPAAGAQSGQARQAAEMALSVKAVGAQEPAASAQSGQAKQAAEVAVSGKAVGAKAVGAKAVGAKAVGAKAVGAKAVGAEAVGAEAVGAKAVGAEEPATGRDAKMLVPELVVRGGRTAASNQELGDAARQAISATRPAPSESPIVASGGVSQAQPGPGEVNPKTSVSAFEKTDNKANADQQTRVLSESPDGNGKEAGLGEKGLPSDTSFQKLNPTQVQTTTGQLKGRNSTNSDSSSSSSFERIVSPNDPRIPVAEQPSGATQTAKANGNASSGDVSPTVGEQIQESIRGSIGEADKQIAIRLNPPELGKVLVKFQEHEDQITGLLEVSKAQTRVEIQQALPEIVRNLQELGVQIRRLEVVLTSEQERQGLNGESTAPEQDNFAGQRGSPNPNAQAPNATVNELSANAGGYTEFAGRGEAIVTDKSIDMFA